MRICKCKCWKVFGLKILKIVLQISPYENAYSNGFTSYAATLSKEIHFSKRIGKGRDFLSFKQSISLLWFSLKFKTQFVIILNNLSLSLEVQNNGFNLKKLESNLALALH